MGGRLTPAPAERRVGGERLAAVVDSLDEPGRSVLILAGERKRRGKPARSWAVSRFRVLSPAWPPGLFTMLAECLESADLRERESVAALAADAAVAQAAREADEDYVAGLVARRKGRKP